MTIRRESNLATIAMPILAAALSISACGSDETDDGTGGSASGTGGSTGGGGAGGTLCADPPDAPANPTPADGGTDVDSTTVTSLDWDETTGAASYDAYFGACPVPAYPDNAFQNVTASELTGVTLDYDTVYCWQAVSIDGDDCVTEGPSWTFTTAACNDPVSGPPTVSADPVHYPPCTISGVHTLVFSEDVVDVTNNLTWTPVTGTGTLDTVTQIDGATYEVAFSGVADGDSYTLSVGTAVVDSCGFALSAAADITITIGGAPPFVPVPSADFTVSPTSADLGSVVNLADASINTPTSWLWTLTGPGAPTFENGTVATDQNIDVSFGTVGLYTAELQATNAFGTCSTTQIDVISQEAYCSKGTGTNTNQALPMLPGYNYSYAQSIYLSTDLCGAQSLSTITWEYNGNTATNEDIIIYLGHTTKGYFNAPTDWIAVSGMTQVYAGTFALTATPGWATVTLDTPFAYNGTDNLVVAVDRNTGSSTAPFDRFYCETTGNVPRSIMSVDDVTNPDPAAPPTGNRIHYIANVRFE